MQRKDSVASHPQLAPLVVTGGALGALLILLLIQTPSRMIDGVQHFDLGVLALLGRFARRSRVADTLIWSVWTQAVLQSGVVMALVWGAWFSRGEGSGGRDRREAILSSLIGLYASIVVTLAFRVVLPFRARPMVDPTSGHQMPYLPSEAMHTAESTSFPSGHATVLFALALTLWAVSRTLGVVAGLHGLFVVCLPRVYFGRHWASDIVAGAVVALGTVSVLNELLRRHSLVPRLLEWSERHAAKFYGVFFLSSLDIATDFMFVKTILKLVSILRLAGGAHITRIVMMLTGLPSG